MHIFGTTQRITYDAIQDNRDSRGPIGTPGIAAKKWDFLETIPPLRELVTSFYNALNTQTSHHYVLSDIQGTPYLISRTSLAGFIQRHRAEFLAVQSDNQNITQLQQELANTQQQISTYIYGLHSQQISTILETLSQYQPPQAEPEAEIVEEEQELDESITPDAPSEVTPQVTPQTEEIAAAEVAVEELATEVAVVPQPSVTPAQVPATPAFSETERLERYTAQQKQRYGEPVGSIELLRSDGTKSTITMHKVVYPGKTEFYALNNEWSPVGHLSVEWLRVLKTGKFGSDVCPELMEGYSLAQYGKEEFSTSSRIFINMIQSDVSRKNLPGVGSALFQTAIEFGLTKGCEGRIDLTADYSSHAFHYKMGLRAVRDENNEAIVKAIEQAAKTQRQPNTSYLGSVRMYMPEEACARWLQKVKAAPILEVTKQHFAPQEATVSHI